MSKKIGNGTKGKNGIKRPARGKKYVCGVCGLGIVIDEQCCCENACDIVCCGEQMVLC